MSIFYGVIGCGEHAERGHIIPGNDEGFVLKAVFDPKEANARSAAALSTTPVTCYASYQELLAAPEISTVMIVSPDQFHPEQFAAAVAAGKHIMIDKPLAIDRPGMEKVLDAMIVASQKKLVVTSCHPRRFDPPYQFMREAAMSGRFGKVLAVHLDFSYHAPSEPWKSARSLLLDHFPHEIDYINYLLGPMPFSATRVADSFDHYAVTGHRRDGVMFTCLGTRRLESSIYPEEIRLRFERGDMTFNTKSGGLIVNIHEKTSYEFVGSHATVYKLRFGRLAANFADSIRGTGENYLTPQDLVTNTLSAIMLVETGCYESPR